MDPTATLNRMYDALAVDDDAEAEEAARNLTEWLARGGFEPDWAACDIDKATFAMDAKRLLG